MLERCVYVTQRGMCVRGVTQRGVSVCVKREGCVCHRGMCERCVFLCVRGVTERGVFVLEEGVCVCVLEVCVTGV